MNFASIAPPIANLREFWA